MTDRNRLRRRTVGFATVAAALLTVSACASSGNSGSSPSASVNTKPLVIGASLSLTGDFSDSGKAVERGYQLWEQNVNAAGGILGRKVQLKIVDDTSSPTQVVTNYENLITQDKVDLVFGPFSSLLTIPASQVAHRYGYAFIEPAGGGPKVFEQKLNNLFFVQPAPVVQQGVVFANYILGLPASERPKTAAYTELDDPFAAPIAEAVRAIFEQNGIKTVYKQVYPAETLDMTPIMSKVAAANPDVIVSGTQSVDAYSETKALVQLKYNPKALYESNGANSPVEFPNKVGANNVNGIFSAADWFPGSQAVGTAAFVSTYTKKYGGTEQSIDPSSAEAYGAGQLLELVAQRSGKIDNQTIISSLHAGVWPTVVGDLKWDQYGAPTGSFTLVQWGNQKLLPVYPSAVAQVAPVYPKPNWGG